MDCGTDYVATVNIADGEWHQLTKDYNTSWNIEATSRGKAKDPANCNGRMYFRLTAVVDGVENRDIVIPYYVDDVAITASDIQVGQMEFFESHDLAPIEYLTETDEIFGRVNITNNTGKENSVNVMMAGYNYKNQLVQLISEPLTIGENENSVTYKTQNALNISKGITKAKLMVWSSNFETAKPYAAPCEITGDFNKINNSLNKLYSTGKLCVGFIGGSITQGSGASASTTYGYAYQTIKWMKERFSQYEIEGHVAGVGGTGSDLGTCRLNEELLVYNPDLVFVEFAVNDGGDPGKKASTEGIIRQVKEAVHIPVIGNGDVTSAEKAAEMRKITGCDGVMIGRGVQGNPWIFRELAEYDRTGTIPPRPTQEEIRNMMLRHARMQLEFKGEYLGIREMRKHVAWYVKGMKGAAKFRAQINQVESYEELEELLKMLIK